MCLLYKERKVEVDVEVGWRWEEGGKGKEDVVWGSRGESWIFW